MITRLLVLAVCVILSSGVANSRPCSQNRIAPRDVEGWFSGRWHRVVTATVGFNSNGHELCHFWRDQRIFIGRGLCSEPPFCIIRVDQYPGVDILVPRKDVTP
jgi:hypothetical protein